MSYFLKHCGWSFNHMAGNLSFKTYADLSGCLPSNCKQTLRWAHVSPKLTASRSDMLFSLLDALSSWLLSASLSVSLTSSAPIQTPQLLLRGGLPLLQSSGVNIGCHGDTVTPKGYAGWSNRSVPRSGWTVSRMLPQIQKDVKTQRNSKGSGTSALKRTCVLKCIALSVCFKLLWGIITLVFFLPVVLLLWWWKSLMGPSLKLHNSFCPERIVYLY